MSSPQTGELPRGNGMMEYSSEAIEALLIELEMSMVCKDKRTLNIPASFDTETSSFYDDDMCKCAVCYIWMFGINNTVVYGRKLDDFRALITTINSYLVERRAKLIVYVHNLTFDFSFIKTLFKWTQVFLKKKRVPLYARFNKIEFRDSMILSGGQSLDKISRELRRAIKKATGELDYEKVRFPDTPMTELEMHYCEMDIRSLNEYIREKIEDEGSITEIPYTNTGYVRRYVRNECFKNRERYMDFMDKLTLTPDTYIQAEQAFIGGAVFPNAKYNARKLRDVHSYDIKSSYPYVMCCCYFPMSYFYPLTGLPRGNFQLDNVPPEIEKELNNECCLFQFEAWDVLPIQDNYYPLSADKCQDLIGERKVSNHVISAFHLTTQMTELDFDTFRKAYTCTECCVSRFRVAKRAPLPSPIVMSILKFFNDKTTLDGIKERKADYMIAKNMLNSVYGMMVERIVREIFEYLNTKGFQSMKPDYIQQISDYNEKANRFLYYPWGIWVTAHARHRLYEAIRAVDDDFVYCDTDSVKFLGDHSEYFEQCNKEAHDNIKALALKLGLSEDYVIPTSPKGKKACLGVWENEGTYVHFKSIGSKRYLVEHENGELEITMAGANKKGSLEYMQSVATWQHKDVFDLFSDKLVIPKEYAKRNVATYIDEPRFGWRNDYLGNRCYYYAPSGLHIEKASYTLNVTEDMVRAMESFLYEGSYMEGEID